MSNLRRHIMMQQGLSPIPADYIQISACESQGNTTSNGSLFALNFDAQSPLDYLYIEFGFAGTHYQGAVGHAPYFGVIYNSASIIFLLAQDAILAIGTYSYTLYSDRMNVIEWKNAESLYANDVLITANPSMRNDLPSGKVCLFGCYFDVFGSYVASAAGQRIGRCEFINGDYHYDLYPCVRKSDDAVGYYDLISQTFIQSPSGRQPFKAIV